jgi:hypothetical protein
MTIAHSNKVIISCAITGSVHTPTMSAALPITPDEIAAQSIAAAEQARRFYTCTLAIRGTDAPRQIPQFSFASYPESNNRRMQSST